MNQDAGIQPGRKKGAAIHLRAMRRAFASLGAKVDALDESDPTLLDQKLSDLEVEGGVDLVYERYSLGSSRAVEFADRLGLPFVLEMNTPLIEEEARWRTGPVSEAVLEQEARVLSGADHVIAVSNQVRDYALGRGLESYDRPAVRARSCHVSAGAPLTTSSLARARTTAAKSTSRSW